jgi:AcrR family transcriptional regulator
MEDSDRDGRVRRAELTRENIAEAADHLFAERGIANVTFDDIAGAAGCSRTTVYAHFAGKDDIVNYIVLSSMGLVLKAMQKVMRQPARADRQLRFLGYELVNLCEERPFFYRYMLERIDASLEGRAENPALEEIYRMGERLNGDFARIIDAGVEQGVFRDDLAAAPTGLILWSCLTSLIGLLRNKREYIERDMLPAHEFFDYGFNLILRAVLKEGGSAV